MNQFKASSFAGVVVVAGAAAAGAAEDATTKTAVRGEGTPHEG